MPQKKKVSHWNNWSFRRTALHFPSEMLSESMSVTPEIWILFILKRFQLCDTVIPGRQAPSLHSEKGWWKPHSLWRQSSACLWVWLCMTQLVSLRINCIVCPPFLWSSKAKTWQLAFQVAGMSSFKPRLNTNWGAASLLQSTFTKLDCQEQEIAHRYWINQSNFI